MWNQHTSEWSFLNANVISRDEFWNPIIFPWCFFLNRVGPTFWIWWIHSSVFRCFLSVCSSLSSLCGSTVRKLRYLFVDITWTNGKKNNTQSIYGSIQNKNKFKVFIIFTWMIALDWHYDLPKMKFAIISENAVFYFSKKKLFNEIMVWSWKARDHTVLKVERFWIMLKSWHDVSTDVLYCNDQDLCGWVRTSWWWWDTTPSAGRSTTATSAGHGRLSPLGLYW